MDYRAEKEHHLSLLGHAQNTLQNSYLDFTSQVISSSVAICPICPIKGTARVSSRPKELAEETDNGDIAVGSSFA